MLESYPFLKWTLIVLSTPLLPLMVSMISTISNDISSVEHSSSSPMITPQSLWLEYPVVSMMCSYISHWLTLSIVLLLLGWTHPFFAFENNFQYLGWVHSLMINFTHAVQRYNQHIFLINLILLDIWSKINFNMIQLLLLPSNDLNGDYWTSGAVQTGTTPSWQTCLQFHPLKEHDSRNIFYLIN